MSYFERTQIQAADSASVDAFGRWRTSQPFTLFDGIHTASDSYRWDEATTGSGATATVNLTRASTTLSTTANTAGSVAKQTLTRFKYTPGKSQVVLCTFVLGGSVGGNTKRVGYFDIRNGIFLQQSGSELGIVRRTYTSGSAVDNKVVQADWNLDRMDGTGPSGITLDWTKTQILVIDLEWLGVGRVRVGFNVDGVTYYCHQFLNANNLDVVYMSTASLPIRYEITNDGTGGAASIEQICSTIMTEGGEVPIGTSRGWAFDHGTLPDDIEYAIAAIRLKAADAYRAVVLITDFGLLASTGNDHFTWFLAVDPTLTAGSLSYVAVTDSAVEVAEGDGSQTVNTANSQIIKTGTAFSRQTNEITFDDDIKLPVKADGTPVPLVLVVLPHNNATFYSNINWRELG